MSALWDQIKAGLKNRLTTTMSVGLLADIIIQIAFSFDSSPETNTDWPLVLAMLFPAIGFLLSRDAGTTSEQSGAKPLGSQADA